MRDHSTFETTNISCRSDPIFETNTHPPGPAAKGIAARSLIPFFLDSLPYLFLANFLQFLVLLGRED
jgi:hypothetical protein